MPDSQLGREANRMKTVSLLILGLGLGYVAGIATGPSSSARAEVTEEPRREALKAGSVINEPILREIAATLKRIETGIDGIEKNTAPKVAAPVRAKK